MVDQVWRMDQSHGELLVHTDVTGPAAKMGHRLTIAMQSWNATVEWSDGEPVAADLTVDVDSLRVVRGEGGVKALAGSEKKLARSNALKALDATTFPQIRFHADDIEKRADGYGLTGTLDIHGKTQDCGVNLRVEDLGDVWRMSCRVDVRQSDFGVEPYSALMGAMKLVDTVVVSFAAHYPKDF